MDKFKKELEKLFSDKRISNVFIIILILVFVLITVNVLMPNSFNNNNNNEVNNAVSVDQNDKEPQTRHDYEENQKSELKNIIKKMQGVGEVTVMMTFESGEVKVPAYDSSTQTTETEEKDREGGTRQNKQTNDGTKVVMTTDGNSNEPFITQTNKPKVIGVVIVAEGAEVSKVRANIEKAVSNLYNLPYDKVNVYPM